MRVQTRGDICKSVARVLFSHIGTCVLVVLYCLLGGVLFEYLEKDNEVQICYDRRDEYYKMENKSLEEIKVVLDDTSNSSMKLYQILDILLTYRDNSVGIQYTGDNCSAYGEPEGPQYKWSFAGSFYFAVTVISTIGYGHIAPKTSWGRLTCIAYAVTGIPLVMLCLANIGEILADVFRFVYLKIFCCGFCRKTKRNPASGRSSVETFDGRLSEMSNITTVSNKKLMNDSQKRPETPMKNITDHVRKRPETPPTTPSIVKITTLDAFLLRNHAKVGQTPPIRRKSCPLKETDVRREPTLLDDGKDSDIDSIDEFDNEYEELDLLSISVPLTVTVLIVAVYIIGGAFLFGLFENWDLLQSSYFCFITLSTIGFGDITPGTDFTNPQAKLKMVLGSLYILFGLAILSMAFSLMQEELSEKFRWLGRKLGLINKDDID